ncbi:FAD-dependent monooxygenase [Reinekea sp.]|jgi:2-polyprenyl-6-methoxyphenol hydroxylase-like FAD-dependent oxidoreductase|uniref:FAD-dependent monooxygenase n=1 Tax=Reinekea sp. TaxID=1970455 RepID=UPI002A80AA1A|nr:FAD-dependent monooxygenase [Reinekea sp.]
MTGVQHLRVAIVGASLGGLSAANVLRQLGHDVQVFELYSRGFETRGGALGSVDLDLLQRIRASDAQTNHAIKGHGHFYGDLWDYLYQGLAPENVHFDTDIDQIIDAHGVKPALVINGIECRFDLIIGADGGGSTIRPYVTDNKPSYAGYTVWRGLVPMHGISGPPSGRRTVQGIAYETLGFPCAGPKGQGPLWNCGIYMAMPEADVMAPTRNRQIGTALRRVPDWFLPFVQALFGDANALFWAACVADGKVSPHPVWEFAADRAVQGRILLLGDAAHMASPRTGAGAYTAMVDAQILGEALRQTNSLALALTQYNDNTVRRGWQLLQRSRQAATYFAPEGKAVISPESVLKILSL